MFSRRQILVASGGLGVAALVAGVLPKFSSGAALIEQAHADEVFEVSHSDSEWHSLLSDEQYAILREEGTERAYTSPLNDEHRNGTFACAGCDLALFSSATKFDSRTGWPSFWAPLEHAVATRQDRSFGMSRNEVHCRRCGGHLGHVFDDGPKPTGLRYCMNGLAMTFKPVAA
ncbi:MULTISPECIES: peptide-methionine (R)-S-oxide reductase MsrB [unclassified Pseudomonas]|uniref:peptide-methionine (R)-S-oxide reductase MsrB n=1 Tax=unclassified Pseudomonas TaxID=196821 RepID=UPI00047FE111|nr:MULTISPECIES: peptide-methionine (R)-S-oxide reductase MsrB [unclassified Pseudomonas]POA20970.1 peptide-methionine (R)-S-oxide reductase [Pseudomonas sp. FW305-3-2-15-E-TSA4]POA43905.1 peptide-methionine (R)-S-oxide reductase [Pseudomonas sp. FW305-3-2-15-E-TSA2]SNY01238.1 peptide-methionine (R)-S-oxide reductase [Pseudomonas sp. LAMO17WK12:I5]SNY01334.1 peptide-methionine (R)-S-oxide reductase [Pseudomonas sp. LAMO17WK12:I6]